ncbi:MAG: hypothetical protein JWO55_87 [Candidatus Saccharibacteria bacterium]|nr:hypothetical protein [Candidatus Saccharibacteria bacterium]
MPDPSQWFLRMAKESRRQAALFYPRAGHPHVYVCRRLDALAAQSSRLADLLNPDHNAQQRDGTYP